MNRRLRFDLLFEEAESVPHLAYKNAVSRLHLELFFGRMVLRSDAVVLLAHPCLFRRCLRLPLLRCHPGPEATRFVRSPLLDCRLRPGVMRFVRLLDLL